MKQFSLVRARAPLRVSIAGGGTDLPSYCDIHGGCVLNATIAKYSYTTIKAIKAPYVRFISLDLEKFEELGIENYYSLDRGLKLHKAVYNFFVNNYNNGNPIAIELSTFCDAPIGSGLGSSSTVVVSMVKAFSEFIDLPLDNYKIAEIAYNIERIDCEFEGGRQDQYSASFGGINYIDFKENSVVVNRLSVKNWIKCELESSLLLFHSGISRKSSDIIIDQIDNINNENLEAIKALHSIKNGVGLMRDSLLKGDLNSMAKLMNLGWSKKKLLSNKVANSNINGIYECAINSGALAGKVSGAGGGGFMLLLVPIDKRAKVITNLSRFDGSFSNFRFTMDGCQAWGIL